MVSRVTRLWCGIFYLHKHHGRNFLWRKSLCLFQILDLNHWISTLIDDFERPCLDIFLHRRVVKSSTNKAPNQVSSISSWGSIVAILRTHVLDIEYSIRWVHRSLILGRLADQSLFIGERDKRRSGETALLIGNWGRLGSQVRSASGAGGFRHTNLDFCSLIIGNTRVCRAYRWLEPGIKLAHKVLRSYPNRYRLLPRKSHRPYCVAKRGISEDSLVATGR